MEPTFPHDEAAASTLYWEDDGTWWRYDADGECWRGWTIETNASDCTASVREAAPRPGAVSAWRPWGATLDESEAPYYKWFVGGRTNAVFNAVDKHVLEGHGADIA